LTKKLELMGVLSFAVAASTAATPPAWIVWVRTCKGLGGRTVLEEVVLEHPGL
jgi:hypothetical protein